VRSSSSFWQTGETLHKHNENVLQDRSRAGCAGAIVTVHQAISRSQNALRQGCLSCLPVRPAFRRAVEFAAGFERDG
jgi:hypothetical protein